eukprot:2585838-Prymnesium_polylepis.1
MSVARAYHQAQGEQASPQYKLAALCHMWPRDAVHVCVPPLWSGEHHNGQAGPHKVKRCGRVVVARCGGQQQEELALVIKGKRSSTQHPLAQ